MKRIAVVVTGTRAPSAKASRAVRRYLKKFVGTRNYVVLIHGACSGVDVAADTFGREHGWEVWPLEYFRDLGKRGGPERNVCMGGVLAVLEGCGFECHAGAFPDDDSRGTRQCIRVLEQVECGLTVVELGPRS